MISWSVQAFKPASVCNKGLAYFYRWFYTMVFLINFWYVIVNCEIPAVLLALLLGTGFYWHDVPNMKFIGNSLQTLTIYLDLHILYIGGLQSNFWELTEFCVVGVEEVEIRTKSCTRGPNINGQVCVARTCWHSGWIWLKEMYFNMCNYGKLARHITL
jgi:hypothetical protein